MQALDVWGDPVKTKTTPAGHRVRVAFGTGVGRDHWDRDDVWEMRVTDPDDDYGSVFNRMIVPDGGGEYSARMQTDPERFWAGVEANLMSLYDAAHRR